uniref:Uncharacterized protein n=1 Tax=Sphaerodactylus townsendi TaxID=933632 RepID=A0ACB8F8U7_9SAUR
MQEGREEASGGVFRKAANKKHQDLKGLEPTPSFKAWAFPADTGDGKKYRGLAASRVPPKRVMSGFFLIFQQEAILRYNVAYAKKWDFTALTDFCDKATTKCTSGKRADEIIHVPNTKRQSFSIMNPNLILVSKTF